MKAENINLITAGADLENIMRILQKRLESQLQR